MTNKTLKIKKALEAVIDAAYLRVTSRNGEKIPVNSFISSIPEGYFINVGRTYYNKISINFYFFDGDYDFKNFERIVDTNYSYNDSKTISVFEIMKYLLENKLI